MTEIRQSSEHRIEFWAVGIGVAGAAFAAWKGGWMAGVSLATGAALSLVNYRWLKGGVAAISQLARVQAEEQQVRIPRIIYVKFFARFILLLAAVYVILTRSFLIAEWLLTGLFVVVAAVLAEMIYLLSRGGGVTSGV
ncbi:MAG TPA: hypothetical protein VKR82_10490 [Candidatus Acidoferrales bacterium]|nr:hypothetical protein [Candidatus Acidoferrales bacterium]